jgi:glycolate oxidase FAD binding subunit
MPDLSTTIVDQVRSAIRDRQPLQIIGNNSKEFLGRLPQGEPLTLSGHNGVVEYEPTELVISVRAGTTIAELNSILSEEGQRLGCESPESNRATVGGTLACNLSGPARPWIGSIRDHVLGLRLVNGKGEHLRFGGRVMKNVAGYDVSRLQAGAMGCLGVITEVTLRVYPTVEYEATVTAEMDGESAIEVMNREASRGGPLSGACWVDGKLYLRCSGGRDAVESRCSGMNGEHLPDSAEFWKSIREQAHPFFTANEPVWRLSAKSGAALPVEGNWLIDWGGAQRWLKSGTDLPEHEALAGKMGGQATLWRGGDRSAEVFHARTDAQKQIHVALKQAFDPDGIFNPGRLYSWL